MVPGGAAGVHVLCYGITPDDHQLLQSRAGDLEACAEYLHERGIACALAHPFFAVAAPLTARHRRRLAELFPIWETRNGSRARELNMPAEVYIETHGGTGVGGSDDHAGVDIGRTWTEVPTASTPEQFLDHLRAGRAEARGDQGGAAKWAHSALALACRVLAVEERSERAPLAPEAVLRLAERVVSDGAERGGSTAGDLGPDEARTLLCAWLDSLALASAKDCPGGVVAMMQDDGFVHADLYRRARRIHERRMRDAVDSIGAAVRAKGGYREAAREAFEACLPAVPYVPAITILARETAKLTTREGERRRVGFVVDGSASMHGVTHTIERIREQGVPGYEVEVIGTDARVDRRLPAVAEVEIPFYAGLEIGVPSVPELAEAVAGGRYDLIHVATPGPAGVGAALTARIAGMPLCGSHHTELAAYAGLRTGDPAIEAATRMALSLFYRQCELVLSPSPASDRSLAALGVDPERIARWVRGVDMGLYDPAKRDPDAFPGEVKVLYAGRLTTEKGVDLLADAYLLARERDPRLHLLLAGGGPEEPALRERLGPHATFLGWLDRDRLAAAYASSDLFLFASRTDTYGQVIAEAQASGLPVVAVAEGGPRSLIEDRRTGWLCPPEAEALAAAVAQLAASPFLRERLSRQALTAIRGRTWEAAFSQLAAGWDLVLAASRRRAASPDDHAIVTAA